MSSHARLSPVLSGTIHQESVCAAIANNPAAASAAVPVACTSTATATATSAVQAACPDG